MKHGPNALIDENLPVVIIATRDQNDELSRLRYEKTISNLKEVKARSGMVIALATEGDEEIKAKRPTMCSTFRRRRKSCCRSWRSCPCNCWPITSQCAAAATWISRGTWRSR